jgi:hypothetical protein
MKTWNYKPINTLDHSHLQNIIKMLWRENTWLKEQMSNLGMEVNLQDKSSCIGYLYIALDKFGNRKTTSLGDMAEEFNNHQYDAHNEY